MSGQSHEHPTSTASTTWIRGINTLGCALIVILSLIGLLVDGHHDEGNGESETTVTVGEEAAPTEFMTGDSIAGSTEPIPAPDAMGVHTTTQLEWFPSEAADAFSVYLGTTSSLDSDDFRGMQTATTHDLGGLDTQTRYYWRIDSHESGKIVEGPTWMFETHKPLPPLWQMGTVPFILMLLSIAILPLMGRTHHWWECNRHKLLIAIGLTCLTLLYYLVFLGPSAMISAIDHAIPGEYIPFIVLLFTLYVISGGINVSGDLRATPLTNTSFILIGTLIASFVGTTGASMLLIRPLLQTNAERKYRVHTVIFFIFLVSNIGGSLLPIGDPPLFLGYLKGVPFLWTFNLWAEWISMSIVLLVIYFFWDTWAYSKEEKKDIIADDVIRKPLRVTGLVNFLLLAGIVLCVGLLDPSRPIPGTEFYPFLFMRELLMLGLAGLSLVITPRGIREANRFNYFAIIEVAVIFVGIFITMQVPLAVLKLKGAELGLTEPWHYFWATGILSSFLDNAPTYLVFFQTAESLTHAPGDGILELLGGAYIRVDLLTAISVGAVFMGANTYIGNGPNFMVKAIAEQEGVRMPSFFGYMFYSGIVLIPLFVIVTLVFIH